MIKKTTSSPTSLKVHFLKPSTKHTSTTSKNSSPKRKTSPRRTSTTSTRWCSRPSMAWRRGRRCRWWKTSFWIRLKLGRMAVRVRNSFWITRYYLRMSLKTICVICWMSNRVPSSGTQASDANHPSTPRGTRASRPKTPSQLSNKTKDQTCTTPTALVQASIGISSRSATCTTLRGSCRIHLPILSLWMRQSRRS